jgi:hypothetical protein
MHRQAFKKIVLRPFNLLRFSNLKASFTRLPSFLICLAYYSCSSCLCDAEHNPLMVSSWFPACFFRAKSSHLFNNHVSHMVLTTEKTFWELIKCQKHYFSYARSSLFDLRMRRERACKNMKCLISHDKCSEKHVGNHVGNHEETMRKPCKKHEG